MTTYSSYIRLLFLIAFFVCTFLDKSQAQSEASKFITVWNLNRAGSGSGEIKFEIGASGPVSCEWFISGAFAGSQTLSNGINTLTGLQSSSSLVLKIDTANFNWIKVFQDGQPSDHMRLTFINQWGQNKWQSFESAFKNCEVLYCQASDSPDLSEAHSLRSMFEGCGSLSASGDYFKSWNTATITDMSAVFKACTFFNENISTWNTSNVTNMEEMFNETRLFNSNIGSWDVSKVTNMKGMFMLAKDFNQDLSRWDVSSVQDMSYMFNGTIDFNGALTNWNTLKVKDMSYMFGNTTEFNQPFENWNVSSVQDMSYMFARAQKFNQPLTWNLENCFSTSSMFRSTPKFNGKLEFSNTNRVLDMSYMFYETTSFNQSITNWDVSSVQDMSYMFSYSKAFDQDFINWDVSSVETMERMFANTDNFNGKVSFSNLNRVKNMSYMFFSAKVFNQDLKDWNVDSVVTMAHMFQYTPVFNGKVDLRNAENTQDVSYMFASTGMFNQEISEIDFSGVIDMSYMFYSSASFNQDIIGLNVPNALTMEHMFGNTLAFNGKLDNLNASKVTNMYSMFSSAQSFNQDIKNWSTESVENMSHMFYNTASFNGHFINFNVENVQDMSYMFQGAKSFNKNIENWNSIRVTTMESMFEGAVALNSNLNGLRTDSVVNMTEMFHHAVSFNQPLDKWNTGNVQFMNSMFNGATSFNNNIATWNVANVTAMTEMFALATNFNQNLNGWNTGNVATMESMFLQATNFNGNISNWDVSNVQDFSFMFAYAKKFNRDLSSWNIQNSILLRGMFGVALNFNQNISGWDVSNKILTEFLYGAKSFNQDLSSWNILPNYFHENMLDSCGISCDNYSKSIQSWSNKATVGNSVQFGAAGLIYGTNVSDAHDSLTNIFGWKIGGDNQGSSSCFWIPPCETFSSLTVSNCVRYTSPSGKNLSSSGTYFDTIPNSVGCDSIITIDLTIFETPEFAFPDSIFSCVDSTEIITPLSAERYLWSSGDTTSASSIYTEGLVFLTLTNPNGCTYTDSTWVFLNQAPVIEPMDNRAVCLGGSIALVPEIIGTVDTQYWITPQGVVDTLASYSINTVQFADSGNYMFQATYKGCADSASLYVLVNPLPEIQLTDTAIGCAGQVNLVAPQADQYNWSTGSSDQETIVTNPGNVTLTITDSNGCQATDSTFVVLQAASPFSLGNDTSLCENQTLVLSAPLNGEIHWSTGESTATIELSTSQTVTLSIINALGCSYSDSLRVTFFDNPTVSANSNSPICSGESLQLTAEGAATYQWSFPNGNAAERNNPTIAIADSSFSGTYSIIGTNSQGCTDTAQLEVTVVLVKSPNLISSEDTVCEGEKVMLRGANGESLVWYRSSSGTPVSEGITYETNAVDATTTFYATQKEGNCESDFSAITIYSLSRPTTPKPDDQIICLGGEVAVNQSNYSPTLNWFYAGDTSSAFYTGQLLNINGLEADTIIYVQANIGECYGKKEHFTISIFYPPTLPSLPDTVICADSVLRVPLPSEGVIGGSWTSFGDGVLGTSSYTFGKRDLQNHTVLLQYSITNPSVLGPCDVVKTELTVSLEPLPQAYFVKDRFTNLLGRSIQFVNETTNGNSFFWEFGSTGLTSQLETPEAVAFTNTDDALQTICLTVENSLGCADKYCLEINLNQETKDTVLVPNAFTPNGDIHNEILLPYFFGTIPIDYTFSIYNRWGQKLFETTSPTVGWTGTYQDKTCKNGTYTYSISYINALTQESKQVFGYVNLIR